MEWQSARIVNPHWPDNKDANDENRNKIVRVMAIELKDVPPGILADRQEVKCDAKKFYVVHPDDQMLPLGVVEWVCEHEVLTD